jgi:hypothetical protein
MGYDLFLYRKIARKAMGYGVWVWVQIPCKPTRKILWVIREYGLMGYLWVTRESTVATRHTAIIIRFSSFRLGLSTSI